MRCLSVSQPYADLIIKGRKTIELRKWNTKFRGEFLVHAPKKIKLDACKRLDISPEGLRTGVIIGRVELYDVKTYKTSAELKSDYSRHLAGNDYSDNKYGFLLKNPKELRIPIPYKGSLGFFDARLSSMISENEIKATLFDEEHRYQWIGKH